MRWILIGAAVLLAAGCSSAESRLRENPATIAGMDQRVVERIRRGEVAAGDSADVVRLALGRPLRTEPAANGVTMWVYRDRPRDPTDYIAAGFRHRIVFDPITRMNTTAVEPVDDRLFPNLRTHTIRVSMRDGRVVDVKIVED